MRSTDPALRRPRRALAALVVLLAAAAPAMAGTPPAQAADPDYGIELVRQDAWTTPGQDLSFDVRLGADVPDIASVRVELHARLVSRSAFELSVSGDALGSTRDAVELPLAQMNRRAGVTRVRIPTSSAGADGALRPDGPGVYPAEVQITAPGVDGALSSFVTWFVFAEQPLRSRLNLAWIWQLRAPPLLAADGEPDPAVRSQLLPGGRLGRLARALRSSAVPLSLILGPETVERWKAAAAQNTRLDTAFAPLAAAVRSGDHQVLRAPYVTLDLPSVAAGGLAGIVRNELGTGAESLSDSVGTFPSSDTAFVDPVDDASLFLLRAEYTRRIVVRDDRLTTVAHSLTPTRRFLLTSNGITFDAAATYPIAESWLEGDGSPALRAQRLLAGLSLVSLEEPGEARGLVLAAPADWNPDTALAGAVLRGLADHPFLDPVTLDAYFAAVPVELDDADQPVVRQLLPTTPAPTAVTQGDLDRANESLASLGSLVPDSTDPRVAQAQRATLVAPSSDWTRARALAELSISESIAREFLSGISVQARPVTLTSKRAEVPISFTNATGQAVRVRIRLESTKLVFPEGSERSILLDPDQRRTTERFTVEARATGRFSMRITVASDDNRFPIDSIVVPVQSSVFGGVGGLITIGALSFLALWWGWHFWRTRRARAAGNGEPPGEGGDDEHRNGAHQGDDMPVAG